MSVEFASWYNEVLPSAPGCPQNVALNAIKNSVIEFCMRSRAWKEYPALVSVDGSDSYSIPLSTAYPNTSAVRVERAWYDGKELTVITEDQANDRFNSSDWQTKEGIPDSLLQLDPENIRLVPSPQDAATDVLKLLVSYKPSRAATDVRDFIWERYLDVITSGALYRLMLIPRKPWSDPSMGMAHKSMYDAGIAKANVEAFKGFGKAAPRAKPMFL